MKQAIYSVTLLFIVFMVGCKPSTAPVEEMQFSEGEVQHAVYANEIQWQPCPPNLPSGCEMFLLEGNPKGNGLFSVRFRVQKGFEMPAHTHPQNERVTVLSGQMSVAFITAGKEQQAKHFGPGDYYINAKGSTHKVWADTTSVIQITGIGPWKAELIEN
ncbi:cupin domain-containing protein [Algivirga pacifica]|uniref:ChrR-like cupin domain-containing protein n=1 Tax=Algivirga pacifica TaxID=1162670 RepID=A0ABP9DGU6_9BACT